MVTSHLPELMESLWDNSDVFSLGCDCDMTGSESSECDKISGQCSCKALISGRQCDNCIFGYVGFPYCHGNDILHNLATVKI